MDLFGTIGIGICLVVAIISMATKKTIPETSEKLAKSIKKALQKKGENNASKD